MQETRQHLKSNAATTSVIATKCKKAVVLAEHVGKDYFFFYRKESPFSNFHPACFWDENGTKFFCSEQYMMYSKAALFGDEEMKAKILQEQESPRKCKKYGRMVANFDDGVWKENAQTFVEKACYLKFSQNQHLQRTLLQTGNRELLEAAPGDRRWGIGYSEAKALVVSREKWGQNWLGKALMRVRSRIRAEQRELEWSIRTTSEDICGF